MNLALMGRRGDRRVVRWWRVLAWSLAMVLGAILLVLAVTCVLVMATEGPFLETWWGNRLFLLLLLAVGLALALGVAAPLFRGASMALDRLPALDAPPGDARAGGRARWRGVKRCLVGGVVAAVLVALFYVEEDWRGERAWKRYQQQQEARGVRLDRASLVPPPVPDDQNFAATPFLAPLFDYFPGTQERRDTNALTRVTNFSPRYNAASRHLRPSVTGSSGRQGPTVRSNAWVLPETDLPAWHAAFLKGTNVTDIYSPGESSADAAAREAFRRRYGLSPGPSPAAPHPPAPIVPAQTNIPTRAEAAASVLAGLAECAPVFEELRAASRRPQSRFNLAYDVDNPAVIIMPHYALLKHLGLILKLRASAELALGQTEQAAEDINLIFCLADAIRHEPFLMAYQARAAQLEVGLQPLAEGLARHQWSDPQLRAFEERLRGFDLCADGWRALEGERVFFGAGLIDYVLQSPHRYRVLADGGDAEHSFNWEAAVLAALPSGWLYLEKLSCCRLFDPYLDSGIDVRAHRVSPDECLKGDNQFCGMGNNPEPVRVLRHQFFCPHLVPSLSEAACKVAFAQTGVDTAALACALERCRLARGAFPESLDALAPEFTTALPHDIITGQPLKYRRTPDGQYLLYSVGWNQTDDGGVLGLRSNSTRIDQAEGDWVWRLPP